MKKGTMWTVECPECGTVYTSRIWSAAKDRGATINRMTQRRHAEDAADDHNRGHRSDYRRAKVVVWDVTRRAR